MQDVIIVGASGFGREVLENVREINQINPTWNVIGFIDDNVNALECYDVDVSVIGTIKDWKPIDKEKYILAIASPKIKEKVVLQLKEKGVHFVNLISPEVSIGERTELGEGVVIFGHTEISVDCKIGKFSFFNVFGGIGHDVNIGDFCSFGPKVCISGGTKIGKCVNVGALASTFPGIEVEDYATIGMNSAVIRRVKSGSTVMGVPAKLV